MDNPIMEALKHAKEQGKLEILSLISGIDVAILEKYLAGQKLSPIDRTILQSLLKED